MALFNKGSISNFCFRCLMVLYVGASECISNWFDMLNDFFIYSYYDYALNNNQLKLVFCHDHWYFVKKKS